MLSAQFITQWLRNPQPVDDPEALTAFIEQHPYFVPARYMAAALNKNLALGTAQVYAAHPILYSEKLTARQPAMPAEAPEPIPKPQSPLPEEELLIQPVFTEDYFRHQGLLIEDKLPEIPPATEPSVAPETAAKPEPPAMPEDPKSLMVLMSFTDWLLHFKKKTEHEADEEEGRRALKNMWQKEKLAAALDEDGEDDEIPEDVFRMAVDSIAKEDGLVSESLAEILVKQQKWGKAIDMYRKLTVKNPAKSAYFAAQIESIQKLNTGN